MKQKLRAWRLRAVLPVFALFVLAALPGEAGATDWSGLGPDNNWSTGANWVGGVAPPSSSTTIVNFAFPTPRTSPVVDAPWTINQLNFVQGGFAISGQAITLDGASPRITTSTDHQHYVISSPIILAAPTIVSNFSFLELTGGIAGPGSLLLTGGPGFALVTGTTTFSGGLNVSSGQAVAMRGVSMPGPVTVSFAGSLAADGTIGGPLAVDATSSIGPNLVAGGLRTGNLAIAGFVQLTITGPAQGTQYGLLDVSGTVDLTGGSLVLNGSFVPPNGSVFTIINNDGADPITGTFAGLPEGASVTFNGVPLRISYVGGTGNDVTLSAPAVVAPLATVPTLSEWALLLLAALVFAAGTRGLKRR